jgi:hypothetical protein
MAKGPTIVAMGGGGFSMEPINPLLDDYTLSLTGLEEPRVCFVPTASGELTASSSAFIGTRARGVPAQSAVESGCASLPGSPRPADRPR